ncbi:Glu/Leu/Phe/Val dehydrogenase dimerization domain-containing protein [Tropicimonas marinistellae]|uniref:Glu/Leu/Phe/Val dehydrogenase dimerization domain-containing protein n=1 Tax=Tropicimonas marinistellae TaxID=1739787 RepID=UPI000834DE76|nr:Glu/Leu/Phe/Val dehydrogenase dimerization domain-containing protein [Tropicimonas marinistellae]
MHIEEIATRTHEQVLFCDDPDSGLKAFIAVHDTTLGPGLGGCRMWHYDNAQQALADAMRLSAGMTAKAALASLPFGGAKGVIMGDSRTEKTPQKLRAFGRFVEALNGAYTTGEDVGMSPRDMAVVAEETTHVTGLDSGRYASGDPSPVTAEVVYRCMKLAAAQRFGTPDLGGRRVAVQGLGHVGMALTARLRAEKAEILAADVNPAATDRAATEFGATILSPEEIATADADIFAPCALGGVLDSETAAALRARIVCGAANNQLAAPQIAEALFARGVLYCPDYVVNSGGLISVASEVLRIDDETWIDGRIAAALDVFRDLLTRAATEHLAPLTVAERMVASILAEANRQSARQAAEQ